MQPASGKLFRRSFLSLGLLAALSGCATVGSMMSPYSEKFDCKNSDHGQCIHPNRAYQDAVAGVASKSDPKVTNDRAMLRGQDQGKALANGRPGSNAGTTAYRSYRDSVYQELKGLIELCEQKRISRGYVVTKSLDDFGPMTGLPQTGETRTQIMRIPAPLLCYWMGEAETVQGD